MTLQWKFAFSRGPRTQKTLVDWNKLRKLLGNDHFVEVISVDFRTLPDEETGLADPIHNEELAPLRPAKSSLWLASCAV
jgi:hypothetical protein